MKQFIIVCLFFFSVSICSAQEKHFVFIQSDNQLPFYVSLNGKLYSSSSTGYVILSKLTSGNYNFTVGFAKNQFPEQTFNCSIKDKDLGFNLKNFSEKGWGLFDLQTLAITMATAGSTNSISEKSESSSRPVISFDRKDSSNQKAAAAAATTAAASKGSLENNDVRKDASNEVTNSAENKAGVNKLSEKVTPEGVSMAYVDGDNKNRDTIDVVIPYNTNVTDTAKSNKEISSSSKEKSSGNDVSSGNSNDNSSSAKVDNETKNKTVKSSPTTGNQCKSVADEDDFTRLRKKMANQSSFNKMIDEANKVYKSKCFTTDQIKNLSTLFLSDEGRFRFYEASYKVAVDKSNFSNLKRQFIDPAYATRFENLLQQ